MTFERSKYFENRYYLRILSWIVNTFPLLSSTSMFNICPFRQCPDKKNVPVEFDLKSTISFTTGSKGQSVQGHSHISVPVVKVLLNINRLITCTSTVYLTLIRVVFLYANLQQICNCNPTSFIVNIDIFFCWYWHPLVLQEGCLALILIMSPISRWTAQKLLCTRISRFFLSYSSVLKIESDNDRVWTPRKGYS